MSVFLAQYISSFSLHLFPQPGQASNHSPSHIYTNKCLTEEVFIGGYCRELLLEGVSNLVLGGQEHGQVLGFLKALGITHHLQELSSSVGEQESGIINFPLKIKTH